MGKKKGNKPSMDGIPVEQVEVKNCRSLGNYSHAEGDDTKAHGDYSHAEGCCTTAEGCYAHTEGVRTKAIGFGSHAEGDSTVANGHHSHTEGFTTMAEGFCSHAEGDEAVAKGFCSHAEGRSTITLNMGEHAEGQYNRSHSGQFQDEASIHTVGIGFSDNDRKNAMEIMLNGDTYIVGIGNYDGRNYRDAQPLQKIIHYFSKQIRELIHENNDIKKKLENIEKGEKAKKAKK